VCEELCDVSFLKEECTKSKLHLFKKREELVPANIFHARKMLFLEIYGKIFHCVTNYTKSSDLVQFRRMGIVLR
jgi:hypothetical protein